MKLKIKIIVLSIIVLSFNINCFAGNDFSHTLTLAKYSACKDVAEVIQKTPRLTKAGCPIGRGGSLQSKLKALSSGPFPWRFEITNGYQEGFVYYALLGYANEISGDIPFAYRCYQNSLACIDEDKSFSHPLPRAEVYLAIGRTCLAAGRYMDAKAWLDNAFLEAGDNLQFQAAIDRVGIQRANKIGDYPEIISLFQHLEEVSRTLDRRMPGSQRDSMSQKFKVNPSIPAYAGHVRGALTRGQRLKEKRTTDLGLRYLGLCELRPNPFLHTQRP